MTLKSDLTDLGQRLADIASRFDESMRDRARSASRKGKESFFGTAYQNLKDLFTQDVTRDGLKDLVKRETKDTFRFYTQKIDFDHLQQLPWYKRIPLVVWRVFVAMAYRLSPPRRIAFAVAAITFLWGCLQFVSVNLDLRNYRIGLGPSGAGMWWWLATIFILGLLLLMELRDKLSLKGDLEIAREIQFGLVPTHPFIQDGFTIHYLMRPANTVGGDYYDLIELGEGRIGFVIGDVAGKGMPAALMMALLQGSLRTLLTAGLRGPELISKLNDYLFANTPANRLVTLFYAELNTRTGEMRYINAGHNAPFLMHEDQLERLSSTSTVLGIVQGLEFEVESRVIGIEDKLLLFTDGISEAFNDGGEEYGENRIGEFLRKSADPDPLNFVRALFADVTAFCGDERPGDDMTAMLVNHKRPG
jgi:hypothetical protein